MHETAMERIKREFGPDPEGRTARIALGSIVGAVPIVGGALQAVAEDLMDRRLSKYQQTRIQRVIEEAAAAIAEDIRMGEIPRTDGFDNARPGSRPFPVEVVEGVLRSVQDENEERKLPFYREFIRS